MDADEHRKELTHILHMAYSGELAAAIAYAGHWRSVSNPQQKADIRKIENDELVHRALVGEMLKEVGGKPQKWREVMMASIGSSVFIACFIGGWFLRCISPDDWKVPTPKNTISQHFMLENWA